MASLASIEGNNIGENLIVVSTTPSKTKENCRIATLLDGRKALMHNNTYNDNDWEQTDEGSTHPKLFSRISKGSKDLWITIELPPNAPQGPCPEL